MCGYILMMMMMICCFGGTEVESFDFFHFFYRLFYTFPQFSAEQRDQFVSLDTIGLDQVDGYVAAFGDFDSDRYTDLFIVNENQISVFKWDPDNWRFSNYTSIKVVNLTQITNLAATDFDKDGCLDLLVQGKGPLNLTLRQQQKRNTEMVEEEDAASSDIPEDENLILLLNGNYHYLAPSSEVLPSSVGPVIIMDANADLYPDLFGQLYQPQNNTKRYFWINNKKKSFELQIAKDLNPEEALDINHSNAFVDIDGNCLADLVIKSASTQDNITVYQIFINKKTSFSEFASYVINVPGAGQLTFADFDRDGSIDILFPVCYPPTTCEKENTIHILYNTQPKLCQSIFEDSCLGETELCDVNSWNIANFSSTGSGSVVIVPKRAFGDSTFFITPSSPFKIRTGDYNLDGYTDILVSVRSGNTSKIRILTSVACSTTYGCTVAAIEAERRTFEATLPFTATNQLEKIDGAYAATFYDFNEDGTNDVLVLTQTNSTNGMVRHSIRALYNNLKNDASFFKTLVLNGVCPQWCPGVVAPDPRPYGVNQYGATIKFSYSDMNMNGKSFVQTVPQLSQSTHLSLQTPYTLNGVGRPANYISYFFFGIPYIGNHWYYWSGVIPNSQVVGIPYPPEKPDSWVIELYLIPSVQLLFWIVVSIIVSLILNGLIITYFTKREKKQDEAEKKEREHLFSFKAL